MAIAIPSLWIYYIFCADSFPPFSLYREAFGNPEHYLDLTFESNPEGPLLGGRSVRFSGHWIDAKGQYPVEGVRVKRSGETLYQLRRAGQGYRGELVSADAGCEPYLRLESNGETTWLRAAFCE